MLVTDDRLPQQCPVVGNLEETGWSLQCPMASQWIKQPVCNYNVYNSNVPFVNSDLSVQCYNRNYPVCDNVPQYYQHIPHPPQNVFSQQHLVQNPLNLPCNQNQQWDYNSMCYNVDGQPCQYTNVVDLEDFM